MMPNPKLLDEAVLVQALDFVVGEEARVEIGRVYELLDKALRDTYLRGRRDEAAELEVDHTLLKDDAFHRGYREGYQTARAIWSGAEVLPAYQGDSGDEAPTYETTDDFARSVSYEQDDTLPPMQEQRDAVVPPQYRSLDRYE